MKKVAYPLRVTSLVALVAILATGRSLATVVEYNIQSGGLETFNVTIDSSTIDGALAGGILINEVDSYNSGDKPVAGAPASYVTVCTDIQGTLYLGQDYTYNLPANFGTDKGVAPTWGSDNANGGTDATSAAHAIQNAAALFYAHFSVLNGNDTDAKAALQLAVWDALYNTSASGVINGTRFGFTADGADQNAVNLANLWLAGLDTPLGTYAGQVFIPNPLDQGNSDGEPPQELLYMPVPEAATIIGGLLLLLPFGSAAASWAKRKRRATAGQV